MASRNKKGKVYGIFKSEFHISFFHKPSMEETDIYYYAVLEDYIFMKMRLLYDIVLVIDELYPLTTSYLGPMYEKIFNLLKSQTAVTVMVSLIGNAAEFRQTCIKLDAPIIDDDRFIGCAQSFYTKYKNYCGNIVDRYGFFLIALKEEAFSVMEHTTQDTTIEFDNKSSVEPIVVDIEDNEQETKPSKENQKDQAQSIHPIVQSIVEDMVSSGFGDTKLSFNQGIYTLELELSESVTIELIVFNNTLQLNPIISNSVGTIMDIFRIVKSVTNRFGVKLYFVNISEEDISYPLLSMEHQRVNYFPQELKNTFVNPRLQVYLVD